MVTLVRAISCSLDEKHGKGKRETMNAHQGRWRCLAEITLASALVHEHAALTEISQVFQALHIVANDRARLQTALIEAVAQAGIPDDQPPTFSWLVRLWVSQRQVTNDAPVDRPPSDAITRKGIPSSGGWGFFLVVRNTGEIPGADQTLQQVVELFLYQEGEQGKC